MLLSRVVALHDIADVENFVSAVITRAVPNLEHQEFQDLKAEGIAILYKLAKTYEPHRTGYARPGSFAGYASMFLPRKLGDAWHRQHPEHQYVTTTDAEGKVVRRWRYHEPPESLSALMDADAASWRDDRRTGEGGGRGVQTRLDRMRTGLAMVPLASPHHRPIAA